MRSRRYTSESAQIYAQLLQEVQMVTASLTLQGTPFEKIAFRIDEAVRASGLGRTTIYNEIKAGRLKAVMVAGRRLILRSDLEAYLRNSAEAA